LYRVSTTVRPADGNRCRRKKKARLPKWPLPRIYVFEWFMPLLCFNVFYGLQGVHTACFQVPYIFFTVQMKKGTAKKGVGQQQASLF